MRFALSWTGVFLGSALFLGCSAEASDLSGHFTEDTTTIEDPEIDATLTFEGLTVLELSPGEQRLITVIASPPDAYEMYFALRDAPGDTSLDTARLVTGKDGRATIKLHAPSTPASFTLRASIHDGPTAELPVSISKQGVGAVEVLPQYDGERAVGDWVASVVVGTTCDALRALLPGEPKGALVATSPSPENPLIQSVPVGPKLAVAVRAGYFAWGCADAHDLAAGQSTKVKVHVVDVPLALSRTSLDLTLAYEPVAAPYAKMLSSARSKFLDAFLPPQKSTAQTVLDAMSGLSGDYAMTFDEARYAGDWDGLAEAHFAQMPVSLGTRMNDWINLGFGAAAPSVTGLLTSIEGVPGKALFLVDRIGGLDAASAGAPPMHLMSWTSSANDKVFLSGTVYWLPSRFVGTACKAGADQDLGGLDTMGETLSKVAGCSELAATLGASDTCDTACLTSLCRSALTRQWQDALDVSAADSTVATIDIGASAVAKVDDVATPVAISGTWLGNISDGEIVTTASGEAGGVLYQPDDDPPPQSPSGNSPE